MILKKNMKINMIYIIIAVAIVLIILFVASKGGKSLIKEDSVETIMRGEAVEKTTIRPEELEKAYFSGGCFWCSESDFEKHDGVVEVLSGYSGGDEENPNYN